VQDVIGLDDGSVLRLTIARYFSPKDHVIDGVGVAPDLRVPPSTGRPGRDAGLEAAVRELATGTPG
jgi:carboxyl-terminal processing protease